MAKKKPRLTIKQILAWADAYYKRNKSWPQSCSEKIPKTGGETWDTINHALSKGRRGMRRGGSLARLLNKYRRPERGL